MRVAAINAETRNDATVRTLAAATPPRQPINSPLTRMAAYSGIAFLSPLMLGFLLGFKRDTENCHNEAVGQN